MFTGFHRRPRATRTLTGTKNRKKSGSQSFPISPGMFQQLERRADIHSVVAERIKTAVHHVAGTPDGAEAGGVNNV